MSLYTISVGGDGLWRIWRPNFSLVYSLQAHDMTFALEILANLNGAKR